MTAVPILAKTTEKQCFLQLEVLLSSLDLRSVPEIAMEMVTCSSHCYREEITVPRLKCTIASGGDQKTPRVSDRDRDLCVSTESDPSHLPL